MLNLRKEDWWLVMISFKYRTMIKHLQKMWLKKKMQIFLTQKLNCISKNQAGGGAKIMLTFLSQQ